MKHIYYISKKIHQVKSEDKKVSQAITKIARLSIIIAVTVNIITLAVVTGFQNKVKEKVIGFGSHATIFKAGEFSTFESAPIVYNDSLVSTIKNTTGVKNIQPYAYKPALLQSEPDTVFYKINDSDTFQIKQEINGAMIKGVSSTYNWDFFQSHLIDGKIPNVKDSIPQNEILISSFIARNLNLNVGKSVNIFFIKNKPIRLKYKVAGIFKTGLQEFDEQIVVCDIRDVQKLNDWGIQAAIRVADTLTGDGKFILYGDVIGGNRNYRYNWGKGFENLPYITFCEKQDTVIRLIASDYNLFMNGFGEVNSIPDTAYLKISIISGEYSSYNLLNNKKEIQWDYLNDAGTIIKTDLSEGKSIVFEYIDGKGSFINYVGGYEIEVEDFNRLDEITTNIKYAVYYQNFNDNIDYRVKTVEEDQQEIFIWLNFLNINVSIILILMFLIGTINMGSGLLVLIITKTQLIGLLKSLGANNWFVRKIFLYQVFFIIFKGVIIGNIIGIGICLLQQQFNIIPLNPEVYYLDSVPVELRFWHLILLNAGTIVLCTAALIIPSYVVTKISPIKALKFN